MEVDDNRRNNCIDIQHQEAYTRIPSLLKRTLESQPRKGHVRLGPMKRVPNNRMAAEPPCTAIRYSFSACSSCIL